MLSEEVVPTVVEAVAWLGNRCKKEGHKSVDCTETVTDESGRTLVMPYIPSDFTSDDSERHKKCTSFDDQST